MRADQHHTFTATGDCIEIDQRTARAGDHTVPPPFTERGGFSGWPALKDSQGHHQPCGLLTLSLMASSGGRFRRCRLNDEGCEQADQGREIEASASDQAASTDQINASDQVCLCDQAASDQPAEKPKNK